jgi:TolB-like protein
MIAALIIIVAAAAARDRTLSHIGTARKRRLLQTAPAAPAIPEKLIAVLPFENLSRDPDNA